jgi:molecular chaperone HscB
MTPMTPMNNDDPARVLQLCRTCGGGAPLDAHFCPQCTKILSLGRHADYFTFFGVPRKLNLDAGDLERRFRTLSREFHPDYFYNATSAERRASLERSSYLNDAYRVLRQPTARIEYLLSLEGLGGRAQGNETARGVPPSLLEEVFELNEELDEIRELKAAGAPDGEWKPRLERARQPIEAKRAAHEADVRQLMTEWDALVDRAAPAAERRPVLESLRDRMLEQNYLNNLLSGIAQQLQDTASTVEPGTTAALNVEPRT